MRKKVLDIVKQIPRGKVATYGQIAHMSGHPGAARQVGRILYGLAEIEEDIPWQRVINSKGSISTYRIGAGELQLILLQKEGVKFNDSGHCKLSDYQWNPEI